MSHTKGPWFIVYEPVGDEDAGITGYEPSGEFVSGSPDSSDYVVFSQPGNAHLVEAAPLMYEALEPFADVDGEGDEDFPDDTPVVVSFGRTKHYAIKLGDFRKARAALKLTEAE